MRKKVLIALRMAGVAGQEKFAGLFRFLRESHGDESPWDVQLVRTTAEFSPEVVERALERGVDGFIVSIPEARDANRLVAKSNVPTVVMDISSAPLESYRDNIVFLRNSGEEIGREAARYFIGQGRARSYGFLHATGPHGLPPDWSLSRHASFRETLRDSGFWCAEFFEPATAAKLPRPAAVMAANDDTAFELVAALKARRVRVPQDVAVLGVDNDALICENCSPRLSSVQPDFEQEGYAAAKALSEMMAGALPAERTVLVGVKSVVRRDSTAELSQSGRLVQKAVAYINRNALRGIGVDDVVAHLKCSRRLADLRFRQLQGRTILEAITERRLDEVKRRLATTDDPIDSISAACGYSCPNYLKNLFKRRFMTTMSEFRRRARGGGGKAQPL